MAKLNPLEDPPSASSSDDEELDSLSGNEEETEEQISDDSEESIPVAKPKEKKVFPAMKSCKKRSSESTSKEMNPKRVKKVPEASDTKKPLFQRLWSEEDEILLLQGMINFEADTGKSAYKEMNEFHEYVKESISFEASKNQFVDKIRYLKKKYLGKLKDGVEFFSVGHDKKCMKLAKIIWESDGIPLESAIKKNLKALEANCKKVEVEDKKVLIDQKVEEERDVFDSESKKSDWFDESFVGRLIMSLGVDEHFVRERWSKVSVESKKAFEEKWKVLQGKEMRLVLEKIEFMREVSSVIAETS